MGQKSYHNPRNKASNKAHVPKKYLDRKKLVSFLVNSNPRLSSTGVLKFLNNYNRSSYNQNYLCFELLLPSQTFLRTSYSKNPCNVAINRLDLVYCYSVLSSSVNNKCFYQFLSNIWYIQSHIWMSKQKVR